MEDAPTAGQRDVVLALPIETLQDMAIRAYMRPPDRLLLTLLRSPRVRRVVVAEPFRSHLGTVLRGGRTTVLPPSGGVEGHLVSPQRWRRKDPVTLPSLRAAYRRYDRRLGRAAGRAGCKRPVVITMYPPLAGFADMSWAGSVMYYARDDWATHPSLRRWHPAFRHAYEEIRRRRLPVIAVSRPLLERLHPTGAGPTGAGLVVHNGVDPAEWLRPPSPPDWLRRLPRPWCVYAGTVDTRLDLDMIRGLASAGTVILAGPIPDEASVRSLRMLRSVRLPGHLPRPAVTGLIAAADVCLLTHRSTPLTEAMDPIKIYEYLAAGRPVLATDLAPVRGIGRRVRLLRPGDDPVAAMNEILTWPAVTEADRLDFVADNSWSARHVAFLDFVLGPAAPAEPRLLAVQA
ncbi:MULTISPECIES: glycosyltransferase [unclassified Frankia]